MVTTKAPSKEAAAVAPAFDLSKLSSAELIQVAEDAQRNLASKRAKELSQWADQYAAQAQGSGFTVMQAIEALYRYLPESVTGRSRAVSTVRVKRERQEPPAKPYEIGVTYTHEGASWVGGSKGRRPPWLKALIPDDLAHEEAQQRYKKLAAK